MPLFGIGQHLRVAPGPPPLLEKDLRSLFAERQAARAGELVAIDVLPVLWRRWGRWFLGGAALRQPDVFVWELLMPPGAGQRPGLGWAAGGGCIWP